MLALAALLDHKMNAIFQDILPNLADADPLEHRRATVANRVVILCRELAGQVQRYEHLYVADYLSGLLVIDISNPFSPAIVGAVDTPGDAVGIAVAGHAYVADELRGLQVIDVSNPFSPVVVGSGETPGYARDVAVAGSFAYVADYLGGIQVIDVSSPTSPLPVGGVVTPGVAQGVAIAGSYIYVADGYVSTEPPASGLAVVLRHCATTTSTPTTQLVSHQEFVLGPVRPFPAREAAIVSFALPRHQEVMLEVYDVRGRRLQRAFQWRARSG